MATPRSGANPRGPCRCERGKLGVYTIYLRNRWNVLPAGVSNPFGPGPYVNPIPKNYRGIL